MLSSFSSDDQQSNVGNDIEDQKGNFEQPEERVNDHIVGFSGNGEPFALYAIHEIRGEHEEYCPQNEDAAIYDCTPHEERRESLNIHDDPPLSSCIQYIIIKFLYKITFVKDIQEGRNRYSTIGKQ